MAGSYNHQLVEYSDRIVSRYKRSIISGVTGIRLHPKSGDRIEFFLKSDWKNYDLETNTTTFCYETDVIEIYSPEEDRVFRILNRYLFEKGLLVPFEGERDEVDLSNAVADTDLTELAGTKNLLQFKKRLKDIDSKSTLVRLLDVTKSMDRPYSFVVAIEERMKEV